jgi:EAL domain-containing protein (putative c-di-GMP-specific phosphodiesterase class I)
MINDLINNKSIEVHLQPIVSIKDKKVFAYEALTRAIDRYDEPISPLYLFEQAKKEDIACTLDEYVRELALVKFQKYYHADNDALLFLKFDSAVIEKELAKEFISTVYKYNIPPKNIVVEVKEDKIRDTHLLKSFIDRYKKHGFLIAIDDFGTAYSSFDRLEYLQPEIVKVDRSLIYNVQNNLITSELLSAISNMCHQVGAIVIAEGVEHKDEVMACMKKEIDLFQGFWFSRVKEEIDEDSFYELNKSMEYIGRMYKELVIEKMDTKRELLKKSEKLVQKVGDILEDKGVHNLELLDKLITQKSKIQAIYLIDEKSGMQVGDTVIHSEEKYLFKPTKAGKDHTLSEYYFIVKESLREDYLSSRYVSKASGSICRTYASKIEIQRVEYIVCFDILD